MILGRFLYFLVENTKLPTSDGLRHPHPFRGMTDQGALMESFLPWSDFLPYPTDVMQGLGN